MVAQKLPDMKCAQLLERNLLLVEPATKMFYDSGVVANLIVRVSQRVQMQQETSKYYAKVAQRYSLANQGTFENSLNDGET